MADESHADENTNDPSDAQDAVGQNTATDADPASTWPESPATDTDDEGAAGPEQVPDDVLDILERRMAQNRGMPGVLIAHFPSRDVRLTGIDGDAALRLLTAFRRRSHEGLADPVKPWSDAGNIWMVLDLDAAYGFSWLPHGALPSTDRMAVDPPASDAAA